MNQHVRDHGIARVIGRGAGIVGQRCQGGDTDAASCLVCELNTAVALCSGIVGGHARTNFLGGWSRVSQSSIQTAQSNPGHPGHPGRPEYKYNFFYRIYRNLFMSEPVLMEVPASPTNIAYPTEDQLQHWVAVDGGGFERCTSDAPMTRSTWSANWPVLRCLFTSHMFRSGSVSPRLKSRSSTLSITARIPPAHFLLGTQDCARTRLSTASAVVDLHASTPSIPTNLPPFTLI